MLKVRTTKGEGGGRGICTDSKQVYFKMGNCRSFFSQKEKICAPQRVSALGEEPHEPYGELF